jgi:F-type H+-transporting ATPase subunit f
MFAARLARAPALAPRGARLASSLPIPPKIATPAMVSSGGSSARMDAVVGFYKALPKGEAPAKRGGGIKARFFDGKNASSKPIVAYIAFMLLFGYTIDVSSARAGVECGAGLTYHTDSTTCT